MNRVTVTVSGAVGTGKSAICGEIEILCKALGLDVQWSNGKEEKGLTHADWTTALEMYRPTIEIIEAIEKTTAARAASSNETGAEGAHQLSTEIGELKSKLVSYEREREDQIRYLAAQSEEIANLKYQLAHAAARVELTKRQRMDLLLVAADMSVSGDAELADALRALLQGVNR